MQRRYLAEHPGTPYAIPPLDVDGIIGRLRALAPEVEVRRYGVDPQRMREWEANSRYPAFAYVVSRDEKILEHQVSWDLLDAPPGGTLVDVASCRSYFPAIVRATGRRCIAQDLSYPQGLRGDVLGGDAAAMDLPDAFADGMTLHCSFEHFEGDADTRFVREAARVLKPGGKVAIQPLYIHQDYFVLSDPYGPEGVGPIDDGAYFIAAFGYSNRFGRHYDPQAFVRRVAAPAIAAGLRTIVYIIDGAHKVSQACYLQFAMVLERVDNAP